MADPILQRAAISQYFYLHTDICALEHVNSLLPPGNDPQSLTTMKRGSSRGAEFELANSIP